MTIDIADLTRRVLAIRRGELPADSVTDDELRAALEQQRARFAAGATREGKPKASKPKKAGAQPEIAFNFDFVPPADSSSTPPTTGGLF